MRRHGNRPDRAIAGQRSRRGRPLCKIRGTSIWPADSFPLTKQLRNGRKAEVLNGKRLGSLARVSRRINGS